MNLITVTKRNLWIGLILVFTSGIGLGLQVIKPDGIVSRTEVHRVDISSCDQVKIAGPLERLMINNGEYIAYWFKKYGQVEKLTITCIMEGKDGKK